MAAARRWTYFFGNGKADGRGDQKELIGGKGAGLAEMTRIGLPVPAGFTITTEACAAFNKLSGKWPAGLDSQVRGMLKKLEKSCKKKLGDVKNPLLVSVRSGAAQSMPGMMETILNLGLNDASVEGLSKVTGNRRFALDAYRRLIMMYGSTAKGIDRLLFENAFDELKQSRTRVRLGCGADEGVGDTDVNADELDELITQFKNIYREHGGHEFPQDPFQQLKGAIDAVFDSWMAEKAITYRKVENITGLLGTAVNVCQMVFGNMGDDCATGVCFTRDPSTGEATLYGDALINAQGEDVVAGVRTPIKLEELKAKMPAVYDQLEAVRVMLEVHYRDMQDLEFTVERGKLYMLQCRAGKRSPQATFRIAVDQATKGLMSPAAAKRLAKKKLLPAKYVSPASKPIITKDQAIGRIEAVDMERLFYPVLDSAIPTDELEFNKLGEGIGAVPGAATGQIVFSAAEAEQRCSQGDKVILVRKETSPEDVGGMHAAVGILTATGGKTSHAAVVARGWGKCCIVGCGALAIDYEDASMTIGGRVIHEGQSITLDGGTGRIFEGELPLHRPTAPPEFETLMGWCDKKRRLKVRANADTPADATRAVELGAEGIGLCRTEHMFFDSAEPQRLLAMREMILASNESGRRSALNRLLPFQVEDFIGIFTAMEGRPVTVRLLDPPLHEFLPQHDNPDGQQAVADALNAAANCTSATPESWTDDTGGLAVVHAIAETVTIEDVQRRVDQLHEANPMLGHRGCRLCITYPEILEMQVRAIVEAAIQCTERGIPVLPEIMIPLSIDANELAILVERTRAVADTLIKQRSSKLKYLVGTMVETPRAALVADQMAHAAEFFSFGTNDLTQMTMGLSRDDAGRFLPDYLSEPPAGTGPSGREDDSDGPRGPILPHDPFQSIDVDGVGWLVRHACEQGRSSRKNIKLGICGEHGGDPASIRFCEEAGLDYVSCSPLRIPIARLAAAQAMIKSASPTTRPAKSKLGGARTGKTGSRGTKKTRSTAASSARGTATKKTSRAKASTAATKKRTSTAAAKKKTSAKKRAPARAKAKRARR